MSIKSKQDEIIEGFLTLGDDKWFVLEYVDDLGKALPPLSEEFKTEDYEVKGCQSKVWLNAELSNGKILYSADSNTSTTKGLVSLLIRVFSNESPEDILNSDIYFPEKSGLQRFIGTQRSGGFLAMIKQMKLYALALSSKSQNAS